MTAILRRVLGVDPGTSGGALALVGRDAKGWVLLESPVIHGLQDTLSWLASRPDGIEAIACEDVSWQFTRGALKGGTGHGQGSADMLRMVGAAQLLANILRVPFVQIMPATWRKRVTGNGRATKEQAREWLRLRVRGMPKVLSTNRSDAIAIAIAAAGDLPWLLA